MLDCPYCVGRETKDWCRSCGHEGRFEKAKCPECGSAKVDRRCEVCDGEGRFELTTCAQEFVTPEIWRVMHYAHLWKEARTPPVAGGVLDQVAAFVDICDLLWLLERRHDDDEMRKALLRARRGR